MPTKGFYASTLLGLFLAIAVCAALQSAPSSPPGQSKSATQQGTPQSGYVLKVTTRLVTLDLIATDSHGKPVRDLKPEDLQVFEEHNSRQQIAQLEFIDNSAKSEPLKNPATTSAASGPVYSNQFAFENLKIPPTVLLMDGVNTQTTNQMQGRMHMLRLLKTLPPETPVAVFLLGNSLRVLQGFTSNGAQLQAAVDRVLTGNDIEQNPVDDPNSLSNTIMDTGSEQQTDEIAEIQDFEKEQYAETMDIRVRQTISALTTIAHYLSGIPGRKNLIWVSESFPFSITPSTDTGKNPFAGVRAYGDQVASAANALTDAQVAVYPVDVVGLQTQQMFSASQTQPIRPSRGQQPGAPLIREQVARNETQGTMDELAKDTGGKTCKNTNDLSGCVMAALNNSSSYYELAFYPQNIDWDGKFHRIVVKTTRPGVKLTYRSGYFAVDAPSLAKQEQPDDRLRQGCSDLLPSTSIHLTVQPVPASQALAPQNTLQYLLQISTTGLAFNQTGGSRNLNLSMALCEFGSKSDKFTMYKKDLTNAIPEEVFRGWQDTGIPDYIGVAPSSDTRRLRVVIVDGSTGLTGAIDIPITPSDIAKAAAAAPPVPRVTPSFVEIPDREQLSSPPKEMGSLVFKSNSGASGSLDWNGETLLYRGELTVEQTASALFSYAFQAKFRCMAGNLQPIDSKGSAPTLQLKFHNHDGKVVTVDLKGEEPAYDGDLIVDPSARQLFDQVWKLSHCQAP